MSFRTMSEAMLDTVDRLIGETFTHLPQGGEPLQVLNGVYSEETFVDETIASARISITEPLLGVRLTEFNTVPLQSDVIILRGKTWYIGDIFPDTEAGAEFLLQESK